MQHGERVLRERVAAGPSRNFARGRLYELSLCNHSSLTDGNTVRPLHGIPRHGTSVRQIGTIFPRLADDLNPVFAQ